MPGWSGKVALSLLGVVALCAGHAQTPPGYFANAEALLGDLQQSELSSPIWPNVYGSDPFIDWDGPHSSARTVCSSFVTLLWQHTFHWNPATFVEWMGDPNPLAAAYHDTIAARDGFLRLQTIDELRPGDIIAIVYYPEYQSPTGHVMIVQALPQPNVSTPIIAGTSQWTVSVIDSSDSYHGTTDTRYAHPGGIGRGIFRLYANPDRTIAGHTWSLLGTSLSNYHPQATGIDSGRHLVMGRPTVDIFQSGFESM
jgi:hypothetical protein